MRGPFNLPANTEMPNPGASRIDPSGATTRVGASCSAGVGVGTTAVGVAVGGETTVVSVALGVGAAVAIAAVGVGNGVFVGASTVGVGVA
jgi:hypothetical protein